MLLDGVGDRHIKGAVLKRKRGGVSFQELQRGILFFRKRDKPAVPVDPGDAGFGVPPAQCPGQCPRTAADLQYPQLPLRVQGEKPPVLIGKQIVKSQLSAQIQRHHALYIVRPDRIHIRLSVLSVISVLPGDKRGGFLPSKKPHLSGGVNSRGGFLRIKSSLPMGSPTGLPAVDNPARMCYITVTVSIPLRSDGSAHPAGTAARTRPCWIAGKPRKGTECNE